MSELYGSTFVAAYGETPSPIWLAAISGLTDDECRVGFASLAKQPREYPVNLTQFVAACRPPSGSPRYLGVPVTTAEVDRLLPPPDRQAKPEVIDSWISRMRRKLGA